METGARYRSRASCDLAYTAGPAEWRKRKEDEKPPAMGNRFRFGNGSRDGEWKVAVDIGGSAPGATKVEDPPELVAPATAAPPSRILAVAKTQAARSGKVVHEHRKDGLDRGVDRFE